MRKFYLVGGFAPAAAISLALTGSLATAQRRIRAAFRPKIHLSSCSNLPSRLFLKDANRHRLTAVNLTSAPSVGPSRRWTIEAALLYNPGTSLNSGSAQVAQLVEHATENRSVGGSIPPLGTNKLNDPRL
jgi:hypothetical protein